MSQRVATVMPSTILRFRARASHLDRKLPPGSCGEAAWGGLQDTVPRGGVTALHARVGGIEPDAWEDPALVQIWFRGGADYLVPRVAVGVFTLGSYPRDPVRARALETLTDEVHRITGGQITNTRALPRDLAGRDLRYRQTSRTGRVHIRWDARQTWVVPVDRPDIEVEDARLELARRFFHWHAPASIRRLARWAGLEPEDARTTALAIEDELVEVNVDADREDDARFALRVDLPALESQPSIRGVRLLPQDDPLTKYDHAWLLPDERERLLALPKVGYSPGYIPGAVLVDGSIAGAWQRQGPRVTIHPFRPLDAAIRAAIEGEARSLPIARSGEISVRWLPLTR